MAMKNLVETECGGSNPLMRVASQVNRDKGVLSYDQKSQSQDAADRFVSEFLEREQSRQLRELHGQERFQMDTLLREVDSVQSSQASLPLMVAGQGETWAKEYLSQAAQAAGDDADLKGSVAPIGAENIQKAEAKWADEFLAETERQLASFSTGPETNENVPPTLQKLRGNSSISTSDLWSDEFLAYRPNAQEWADQLTERDALKEEAKKLNEVLKADDELNETEFADFIRKLSDSEKQTLAEKPMSDVWSDSFGQSIGTSASTYSRTSSDAFWDNLATAWAEENGIKQGVDTMPAEHPWVAEFDAVADSSRQDEGYRFSEEAPVVSNAQNAFEEGLKMLKAGDIPSAVLLFEAACQAEPENALAWQYLGTTQAENEHDAAAILALKKCLSLDPNNLTAILALAVSYTNESRENEAFDSLKEWLSKNQRYAHLIDSHQSPQVEDGVRRRFTEIRNLYIRAARMAPNSPDPDVQCGLGVLFNLAGEYDKAVDCFTAALQVKPDDALLWNRLGATLANGNRPEEAVSAYRRALEITPGFLRARFNLGISCINLKAFQEAAEHFLTVLNSQNSSRRPPNLKSRALTSGNVWSSLRLVVSLMGRQELYQHVDSRDLSRLNREFNMEF